MTISKEPILNFLGTRATGVVEECEMSTFKKNWLLNWLTRKKDWNCVFIWLNTISE